ncbi:MAG: RidA family protein [Dehalococcoidia bacterium]|nr:RidA family protein [Dehalococcoidia bacterium]
MTTDQGRVAIWPGEGPKPVMPYSPIVKAGGWVFLAGQLATDFATGIAPEARVNPESPYQGDALERQSRLVLGNLDTTLKAAGCDLSTDVVQAWQWFTSPRPAREDFERGDNWPAISITPYLRSRDEFIEQPRPASIPGGVRRLMVTGAIVEVDLIAIEREPGVDSEGTAVPEGLAAPLDGSSPALRRGDWVFLSAEMATAWEAGGEGDAIASEARVDPNLWYGSAIEKQTEATLQKLQRIAAAAGSSLDRCVKASVYIGHPRDFAGMDRVWREWFPHNPPARVVVPYMGLGAAGARVQVAMTLLAGDSPLTKPTIETSDAPQPFGHEPQAVKAGDFLFFSTQMAFDSSGALAQETRANPGFPFYVQPPKLQMRYILKNVNAICEAAGTTLANICRRQVFHDDFTWFAQTMEEWHAHFPEDAPASTTVEVGGPLLVPGAHLMLDLIGYAPAS